MAATALTTSTAYRQPLPVSFRYTHHIYTTSFPSPAQYPNILDPPPIFLSALPARSQTSTPPMRNVAIVASPIHFIVRGAYTHRRRNLGSIYRRAFVGRKVDRSFVVVVSLVPYLFHLQYFSVTWVFCCSLGFARAVKAREDM
ncbi:hypothetical protein EJ08DRAFT_273141 [Tothia fuscella]|uniref:Uncharacterized protein n=1 Tax=Tothia fuscella TaxID=1048955 RepID=A0A9P4NPT7_9PEZI|nr:hypothetical protein EJ08DRAFT_273141 [Tothia fuscella]